MHLLSHLAASPSLFELVLFLVSIFAGIFGSVLGLGGGAVIIPVLTLFLGINLRYAIGTSIVSIIATSSGAAATYVRDKITNIRVAMLLEVATTIGAVGGAFLSPYIPARILFLIFALVLFFSAYMMFRKRSNTLDINTVEDPLAKKLKLSGKYFDPSLQKEIIYFVRKVPLGFVLMLGAGVLSGLLGIGSGALKVPAMDAAMRLPLKVSSATSNFMIGVTAAASASSYYLRGDVLPILAAPVALGVIFGSWAGTRIMMHADMKILRKVFVVVLLLIALEMVAKSLGFGRAL